MPARERDLAFSPAPRAPQPHWVAIHDVSRHSSATHCWSSWYCAEPFGESLSQAVQAAKSAHVSVQLMNVTHASSAMQLPQSSLQGPPRALSTQAVWSTS